MEIFNLLKQLGLNLSSEEGRALVKGAIIQAFIQESLPDGQAMLRIGSKLVQGYFKQPVEAGQTMKLEVLETLPRLLFQPVDTKTSPVLPETPPQQSPAGSGTGAEETRPTFFARVVEKLPDGHIRIQILQSPKLAALQSEEPPHRLIRNMVEGRQLKARVQETGLDRPLRLGQDVRFIIKETQPQFVIEPAPPKSDLSRPLYQALTRFLSQPAVIPREAGELLAVLEKTGTFPPEIQAKVEGLAERIIALSPKPAEPDVDFVPRLVSSLGLNHPRSSVQEDTARLWSEIIRSPHIHSQHGVDKESLRLLTESTARIFESVESLQTLNQETNRMEQTLLFSFPLFWPGENGKGELAFKRPQEKKRSGREEPYRITLLLHLTRLGRIKADLQIKGSAVQGTIWTENSGARETLTTALDQFQARLKARGIEVENLQVNIFPSEMPPPDSLAAEMLPQKKGLVDLKV